ncbi:MAG: hypothetical protein GWP62_07385 [Gammaproteobacteria bacterium]|jgi:Skp family chaperone for outer membrane proteins|nr:hypothetical protein [Gammaproteobacteria bacterium]
MLIAILTILFLGGGSSGPLDYIADARGDVKTVMEKDDRRDEALDTLKSMKKQVSANNKAQKRAAKDLEKALADDADVEVIWDEFYEGTLAHNEAMLDLRFQLRDQMTREEWEQVFAADP